MDLWQHIKNTFKTGSMLTRLIYANLAVFVAVLLTELVLFFMNQGIENPIIEYGQIPSDLNLLLKRPWTILSYMFMHKGFLHILFNILWLFWMGQIFLQYLSGKKLLSVYILGGFSGALLYLIAYNTIPVFTNTLGVMIGASASVYAVTFAIAFYVPNFTLRLLLIGEVKLKYIAIVPLIIFDILRFTDGNYGGKIAHIGGAIFGFLFIYQYKKGIDITRWFENITNWISDVFKPKPKMKVSYSGNAKDLDQTFRDKKAYNQKEIDRILDKISKSGYNSLSKDEKETLFKLSENK